MHVVKGVCCLKTAMYRVVHNGGWQSVETEKIRHFTISLLKDHHKLLLRTIQSNENAFVDLVVKK